jgi:multiple antibiotic resistance protein
MDLGLVSNLPIWFSFTLFTFSSFFPIVDPIGNVPIFVTLTQNMPKSALLHIAKKSVLLSIFLSLLFGFLGDKIFDFFHLTVDGLKIVGGIIFFLMGFDMLNARISQIKISSHFTPAEKEHADDIATSPIAIPMLCGPGVLTNCIIIMNEASSYEKKIGFTLGIFLVFGLTFLCFAFSREVLKFLGKNGNRVILRLMGLFLMILAVDYFFSGLTPIIQKMLKL